MAIAKAIHKWERVVPLRFARAPDASNPDIATGTFDALAPELDDRGFLPHTSGSAVLPIGLNEGFSFENRDDSRIRLLRIDMDVAGALFVTSENSAVFVVTQPLAGAPLPSVQAMIIRIRPVSAGVAHLEVRFGSAVGPIVHRLQVVVSPLVDVRAAVHVPTITGAPHVDPTLGQPPVLSTRSNTDIQTIMDGVNDIYFPYGIRFVVDDPIDRVAAIRLARQGIVNPNTEFDKLTKLNRVRGTANIYFVPQISVAPANVLNGIGGVATSVRRSPNNFGLIVADFAAAQSTAHELGHLLNLINDPTDEFVHVNTVTSPGTDGTGKEVRTDVVSRRRMLFAFMNLLPDPVRRYRDDVGYGTGQPGAMLTVKQLDNDKTDKELSEARKSAALLPLPPVI